MLDQTLYNKPVIPILSLDESPPIDRIKAGIEEEGLSYTVYQHDHSINIEDFYTTLGVVIVCYKDVVSMYVKGYDQPYLQETIAHGSGFIIGSNAGRYVKKLPFKGVT